MRVTLKRFVRDRKKRRPVHDLRAGERGLADQARFQPRKLARSFRRQRKIEMAFRSGEEPKRTLDRYVDFGEPNRRGKPRDFGLDRRDPLLYRFAPFDDFRAEAERDGES